MKSEVRIPETRKKPDFGVPNRELPCCRRRAVGQSWRGVCDLEGQWIHYPHDDFSLCFRVLGIIHGGTLRLEAAVCYGVYLYCG